MSVNVNSGNTTNNIFLLRAQSATDDASSFSQHARDLMEAFSPQNVLNMLMQIFQVLGAISG